MTGLAGDPVATQTEASCADARDAEVGNLYVAYRDRIHRYLVVRGCSEADADDIVQETILMVRRSWDAVRGFEKPAAYWYKRATQMRWRIQGKLGKFARDPEEILRSIPDPADRIEQVDLERTLMALVRRLPPRQGGVLWLRLVEGFSVAETADILDIGTGTVKSQLHDARKNFEEIARENGLTWEGDTR